VVSDFFNERTGTRLNFVEVPTDTTSGTLCWLRCKTAYNVAEFFCCGVWVHHETVRDREARFAPGYLLSSHARGRAGKSWYVDETWHPSQRGWCYLYRPLDRDGIQNWCWKRMLKLPRHSLSKRSEGKPERVNGMGTPLIPEPLQVLGAEVKRRVSDCPINRTQQWASGHQTALLSDADLDLNQLNTFVVARWSTISGPKSWKSSCPYLKCDATEPESSTTAGIYLGSF